MVRPTGRTDLLMQSLSTFYKNADNLRRLIDLVNGSKSPPSPAKSRSRKAVAEALPEVQPEPIEDQPAPDAKSRISLRLVDYFITTYARTHDTMYRVERDHDTDLQDGSTGVGKHHYLFLVYPAYKASLRSYSKKNFDPFRRGENITLKFNDEGDFIVTSVGQMNIVRWLIENKVLRYIEQHFDDVNREVILLNKRGDEDAEEVPEEAPGAATKRRPSRRALVVSATRRVSRHHIKVDVSFL
jgi:hypothetical protein